MFSVAVFMFKQLNEVRWCRGSRQGIQIHDSRMCVSSHFVHLIQRGLRNNFLWDSWRIVYSHSIRILFSSCGLTSNTSLKSSLKSQNGEAYVPFGDQVVPCMRCHWQTSLWAPRITFISTQYTYFFVFRYFLFHRANQLRNLCSTRYSPKLVPYELLEFRASSRRANVFLVDYQILTKFRKYVPDY